MGAAPLRLLLLALISLIPACEQRAPSTSPSASSSPQGKISTNDRAALVEVVPSSAMQQSPQAIALMDRAMYKHVLMLQDPALITQVLQLENVQKSQVAQEKDSARRFAEAMQIRVIPGTNVIELMIDPAIGGDESAVLAEAVINQYMGNLKKNAENVGLARSVILNNQKNRYQFRKDDLGRELRDRSVRLSIDGVGTPGRLSTKEVELNQLLQLNLEVERKKIDSVNATPEAVKAIDEQLKQIKERTDAAKQDLGDLTNAMYQYLELKDEYTTIRQILDAVNKELDEIGQNVNATPPEVRWLRMPSRG